MIPTTPHPITGEKAPITLGHEFSGVIEEVGKDVHDVEVGQRVVVQPIIYDGTCGACRDGFINCCDKNGFVGLSGKPARLKSRSIPTGNHRLGRRTIGPYSHPSTGGLRSARFCAIGNRWYVAKI